MPEPSNASQHETGAPAVEATLFRQQATLARFGELALRSQDIEEILTEACRLVAEALAVDLAKVAEVQDEGRTWLVRAGVGWRPGIVGRLKLRIDEGSEAYTLRTGDPLICPDVASETRFTVPQFLIDHGVRSLIHVAIIGGEGLAPYGVLQVDSRELRNFTDHDLSFLRTYANLLAAAVERLRLLHATKRERDQLWASTDDLLITADLHGRSIKINPAWTRLLGWTEQDLAGDGYTRIVHPDDLPAVMESVQRLQDTRRTVSIEDRLRAADGSWRRVAWKLSPGVEGGLTGIGRDVTLEREREEKLRDQQDFTRLALTSVGGVGVWTYDAATDRFFCDEAISDLYGIDPVEAAAGISSTGFLANVHPDDLPKLKATMADGLKRGGDVELEYRIRHSDGSLRWVLSRGYTYLDADGRPARRTGVGIETTRQRQLEEQLRQSQKMEAVGQLTGGVAHDFNNLLTVIRSSVDLLQRPNLSEDRRRRYVDAISVTTNRAAKLTSQLLAFARRQALKPEVFNVGESVRGVADMVSALTGSRIRIVVDVPDEPWFVNADPSQFDTAMINLAVNARDAMDGEGTLTVVVGAAATIPPIRLHSAVPGDYVMVSISDTGTGIAEEDLNRIFEPFFTTKEVGKGTGLGLSQVFGFVKQTGGEISVESRLGRGTAFTLYLPRVTRDVHVAALNVDVAAPVDGHGICVLVVEDNPDVGSFATQTLGELGYRSVLAVDAAAALAELERGSDGFDVVFTDVVMPGMNGIDLAQEIRRRVPSMPVVLTSGYSHVLAQNGPHGFELLHKPYSIEQLSRVLTKAARWRTTIRSGGL